MHRLGPPDTGGPGQTAPVAPPLSAALTQPNGAELSTKASPAYVLLCQATK